MHKHEGTGKEREKEREWVVVMMVAARVSEKGEMGKKNVALREMCNRV